MDGRMGARSDPSDSGEVVWVVSYGCCLTISSPSGFFSSDARVSERDEGEVRYSGGPNECSISCASASSCSPRGARIWLCS